jgi:superfamily I DNA and/or RNA helicase
MISLFLDKAQEQKINEMIQDRFLITKTNVSNDKTEYVASLDGNDNDSQLIESSMKRIQVSTVDAFQGGEKGINTFKSKKYKK